ncbi:MAG: patatin family protein [Desulfobacterales bacterium]
MNMLQRLFSLLKRPSAYPGKKALVIEGGGMRGIFLVGVLQAFTDRGYFPWKAIIGSSAGALTGVAYAARQIHIARDAFFTELLTGKLIRLRNVLNPEKHILNLDWMVDTIINGNDPLDILRLKKACPVLITATDVKPGIPLKTIYLNSKKDDIPTALKATAAIPFLYRSFVPYKEHRLLDGALLSPIPYCKALSMGFKETDILTIVTRQKGYRKKEESFWIKALVESYYRDEEHQLLLETLDNRYLQYNQVLDDLENKHAGIEIIYPPEDFKVNRLTVNEKKILIGFEQGIAAGRQFLVGKS